MHGLINRAIQCFVSDTYGADTWAEVARSAALDPPDFEAMLRYDDRVTLTVLQALCRQQQKSRDAVLEDIGNYLVSNRKSETLRRLLRFGGVTFVDFLYSLEDLPDRARLAVPDLEVPQLELHDIGAGRYRLHCQANYPGCGPLLLGILRSLAGDYGALVLLGISCDSGTSCDISIDLLETSFSEGRQFELGAGLR